MQLDPRLGEVIRSLAAIEMPPADTIDPITMRAMYASSVVGVALEPVSSVLALHIPAGDNCLLPARLYSALNGRAEFLIVYFHGGGFVVGDLDTHEQTCRLIANEFNALVLSVAYRLAPEHRFPIPMQDCFAATCWATQNRVQLGAEGLPLLVAGDSAGGNLAAAVCLKARNSDLIDGQLLCYPVLNHDFTTASYQRGANAPLLTTGMMRQFWNFYLKDIDDGTNPLASPLRAPSLKGLPPAYIVTAGFDPLLDEGRAYAERLTAAGIVTYHRHCAGMVHGFMGIPLVEEATRGIFAEAAAFFR